MVTFSTDGTSSWSQGYIFWFDCLILSSFDSNYWFNWQSSFNRRRLVRQVVGHRCKPSVGVRVGVLFIISASKILRGLLTLSKLICQLLSLNLIIAVRVQQCHLGVGDSVICVFILVLFNRAWWRGLNLWLFVYVDRPPRWWFKCLSTHICSKSLVMWIFPVSR